MKSPVLLILPSLAIGLVAGWLLARNVRQPPGVTAAVAVRTQASSVTPPLAGWTKASAPPNQTGRARWASLTKNEHPLAARQREGVIAEMLMTGLDAAAMQAEAASQPPEDQEIFVRETTRVWLEEDPNKASHFVDTMSPGPLRKAGTEELAVAWAKRDPAQASQWAWDQREHHPDAAGMALHQWASQDAPNASAWLATIPVSPQREAMAVLLIESLIQQDPAAARSWIQSLPDPATRQNMLQRLGN